MKTNKIYFPSSYKKVVLNGTKCITIRVDRERGKYKKGYVYCAYSYSDTDWKIKVKIQEIIKTKIDNLVKFGIPKRSIESLKRKTRLNNNDYVELIKFKCV